MQGIELKLPTSPALGATLAVPESASAAALIVQGSGVHDRDGNMPAVGFRSTLYKRVDSELAQSGIGTLRFDKRGHDRPADSPQDYTVPQRLDDLRAGLKLLREDERTQALPLFVIGHSEGAMLVAKLAETEQVAGVVSLAAPFGNTFELGKERARRLLSLSGAQQAKGELALEYYERLEAFFKEGARLLPEEYVEFALPYKGAPYQGWESYEWLAAHWAHALDADPTAKGVPMLVVQGGRDARLWPDNPQRWQDWCESRALADYILIEHMGHDLNDARQKAFRVDDDVLTATGDWVARHTK